MSDRGWRRDGHDHGIALARDFGYTPLYLHYNSGQPIATNGRAFAALMEQLVEAWPVPITDLVLVGHSMGGLVARSACHYAEGAGHAWLGRLSKLICLGTPHHGAPLERAGRWVDRALGLSPYTAPFGRLGLIRSAGVQDLRYGTIVDEKDPAGTSAQRGGEPPHEPRTTVLLPAGISCFAIAATKQRRDRPSRWLSGDGLVPVSSALGWHEDPAQTLPIPPSHQHLCYGLDHFDLLGSHAVYDRLCHWVAQD